MSKYPHFSLLTFGYFCVSVSGYYANTIINNLDNKYKKEREDHYYDVYNKGFKKYVTNYFLLEHNDHKNLKIEEPKTK
jgi:hypothetical protein